MTKNKIREINDKNTTYYINDEKKAVVCSIHTSEYGDVKGKAICDDKDTYDPHVGMKLAYSRASEKLKQYMMDEDFGRCMFYLELAEKYAQRVTTLQGQIDNLRKTRELAFGTSYDNELEGIDLKKLRYKYGRMKEDEEKEYKVLEEKREANRLKRIAEAKERKACEGIKNENSNECQSSKPIRDSHGRFVAKDKNTTIDGNMKKECRSVFIEMD